MEKKKTPKEKELFWNELVEVYFNFTQTRFNETPTFDGSAPRDLKNIIQTLRKRAESKGIEWTQEVATYRFNLFLDHCYQDEWLRKHWLLMNLDRQKDRIFFNAAKNIQWLGQ